MLELFVLSAGAGVILGQAIEFFEHIFGGLLEDEDDPIGTSDDDAELLSLQSSA